MSDIIIRNYRCNSDTNGYGSNVNGDSSDDAAQIGSFDQIAELAYRYKGDFNAANIFCAVNAENKILGVADLEPHISWTPIDKEGQDPDYIYRLMVNVRMSPTYEQDENLRSALLNAVLARAKEIKGEYPDKHIRVIKYIFSDNINEMDFLLSKGFVAYRNALVMKRDLTEEIKPCPLSRNFNVINWKMGTDEEIRQHVEADARCNNGAAWNFETVSWMRYAPEWAAFSAFAEDKLLGSVMTFSLSEQENTTEDIFVVPEWRRKGVAKAVITEALKYLKEKGKTSASLSTDGDNKSAIHLYKSLGYRVHSVIIEFGYDV